MKQVITLFIIFSLYFFSLLNAQNAENNWGFGAGYTLSPATDILNDIRYGTHHGLFTDINYLGIRNKFLNFSPGI